MEDYLVRVITRSAHIRGLACTTTHLVNEACRRHGTLPVASAALGRALTGSALMGALLKTGHRVALKFEGDGPLGKILAEAESDGVVRGYVGEPKVDLPLREGKLDVAGGLGRSGFLTVTKDLRLKEPYRGTVQLYTGEIAEDLAFYLTESEQVPSAVGLGVYVEQDGSISVAGGFLIQSLPPSNEAMIDAVIEHIGRMPPITELLRGGRTPEELLEMIFAGIEVDVLEKRPLAFQCSCSKDRVEQALLSLGRTEIADMIAKEEGAEVTCEFCRERYVLSEDELRQLIAERH